MALKGRGKFVNRPTTTGGKKYDKFFIYFPTDLVGDSQFPLKAGDEVDITVSTTKNRIEISKAVD